MSHYRTDDFLILSVTSNLKKAGDKIKRSLSSKVIVLSSQLINYHISSLIKTISSLGFVIK
jgi:hypothetical protein